MGNVTYVISELDRLCIVAKDCYGVSGAVLLTPSDDGDLLPEVAQIPYKSYDQHSTGSDPKLN